MSLIIAKIINDVIQIESDTKISGENVVRNNPIKGRLKSLVLYHNLVVCYAGDIALGEDAYNYFYDKGKTEIKIHEYINFLTDLSRTNQVDFILTGYLPKPFILKIKGGVTESLNSAWIGDLDAFNEFQKHFLVNYDGIKINDHFTNSFNQVINNQLNESVGEFHITTYANLDSFTLNEQPVPVFQYKIKTEMIIGRSKTIEIKEVGKFEPIPSGNEFEGDHSISYFTNREQERASLGIYFNYGKFGMFYNHGNLLKGIEYKSKSAQTFLNEVYKDTGCELLGFQTLKDSFGVKLIGPQKE